MRARIRGHGPEPCRCAALAARSEKEMGRSKEVVEGNTRGARKARRQQLGKRRNLVVQPRTLLRYETAMNHFLELLTWNGFTLPSCFEEVDRLASMYIEELWEEGDSRYLTQDVLSSLQHFEPHLKRRLLQSWRLIKAWMKHEIPSRAPPLTPSTLSVLAGYLQPRVPEVALGVAVAFHALLRRGELLQVRNKHVICTHDFVLINLVSTKCQRVMQGPRARPFHMRRSASCSKLGKVCMHQMPS